MSASAISGTFSFGVFGDGPYYPNEIERFRHVLEDVRNSDIEWLIHIGDILWAPCTDDALTERLSDLNSLGCPVIYTPGDNEWTDTHDERQGGHEPLERLSSIRRIFFCNPGASLVNRNIELSCQANDPDFAEFCENSRWVHRNFVFATMHLVGSNNGRAQFPARTAAHDAEVERRTEAAIAWLDSSFDHARRISAKGVVIATHANIGLERDGQRGDGFDRILDRLENHVRDFSGSVLLIHGDTHTHRVDHPLVDNRGTRYEHFTRLETFGSPDIGWVRVTVDGDGSLIECEPRLMIE